MSEFWEQTDALISLVKGELYRERSDEEKVLFALRTARIIQAETLREGSSFKWLLRLDGGQQAVFKPYFMWVSMYV